MSLGPVYSVRLFQQQGVSVPTVAFVVPPGLVVVVRSIDCYVGAPTVSTQLIFKEGVSSCAWLSFTGEATQSRSFSWVGRQVFIAGDELVVDPADHPWDVRVSGYHLSAAA